MEQLKNYNVSPNEAEELSTKFLSMSYRINTKLRNLKNELIKLSILEKMAYERAFKGFSDKMSVSKQKATAQANPEYLKANVQNQKMTNDKEYWEGSFEVMKDSHKFYKSLCRE